MREPVVVSKKYTVFVGTALRPNDSSRGVADSEYELMFGRPIISLKIK